MNETLKKKFEEMKAKHPDTVLFFRVGDFYESYGEDAEVVAKELGITITEVAVEDSEPSRSPRMEAPTGSRAAVSTPQEAVTERPERSA